VKTADFAQLKNFNANDTDYKGRKIWQRPGVLANTDFKTLQVIDKACEIMGCDAVLHVAYDPAGHASDSWHYKKVGTAIDYHFVSTWPYYQQVLALETALQRIGVFDTCGLGIYPEWRNPGFHFDLRGVWARWGARYINGKQQYFIYQEILERCKRAKK